MANNQYNPAALQDIFNSTATDYSLGVSDDFGASDSVAQLKSQRLAKRTQDKYTRNGVNYDPNQSAILRQGLEDLKSQQIYSRVLPTGAIFKYQIDPATGNEIPWSGEDTRNLYIAESASGGRKLGLARNDLTADARARGITPFQARYMDKSDVFGFGYNSPYEGDGGDYDGTPGDSGVDPNGTPLLDIELPYQLATDYEKQVHTSSGQIKNRMIGQGAIDANAIFDYGGGKSEYTSLDAPLWNEGYTEDGTPIAEGTPLPGQTSRLGNYQKEDTFEFVDAFQSSLVQLGGKFAKLLGEGYTNVADNFTEYKQVGDGSLERWGKKVIENADKFTGYNPKSLQKGTRQIQDSFRKFDDGNYVSGIVDLISGMANAGPQVVASSLPEVGAIAAASAAGGPASTWATIASLSVANTNDTLDKREKLNNGREASAGEIANVMLAEGIATALDYGAFKFITKLGKPAIQFKGQKGSMSLKEALEKYFKVTTPTAKKELANALGRTITRGTGHGMTEAVQESTTEVIRLLAAEVGTDTFEGEDWIENLDRNKLNILTSGALGFSGGVGFGAIGNTKDTVKDIGSALSVLNKEKKAQESAINVESNQAAEDISNIRSLDLKSRKEAFTAIYPEASKLEAATTPEELQTSIEALLKQIPESEAANALQSLHQSLADPTLTKEEVAKRKFTLQTYTDALLTQLGEEGQQAAKDVTYLNAAVADGVLGDNIEVSDAETTTFDETVGTDAQGNPVYEKSPRFQEEALDKEIEKTEASLANESKLAEEAKEEAKEANPEAARIVADDKEVQERLVTYIDEDGNIRPRFKDSEISGEITKATDQITELQKERSDVLEEGIKEHAKTYPETAKIAKIRKKLAKLKAEMDEDNITAEEFNKKRAKREELYNERTKLEADVVTKNVKLRTDKDLRDEVFKSNTKYTAIQAKIDGAVSKVESLDFQSAGHKATKKLAEDTVKVAQDITSNDTAIRNREDAIEKEEIANVSANIDTATKTLEVVKARLALQHAKPTKKKKSKPWKTTTANLEARIVKITKELQETKDTLAQDIKDAKATDTDLNALKDEQSKLSSTKDQLAKSTREGVGVMSDEAGSAAREKELKRLDLEEELAGMEESADPAKYKKVEAEIEKIGQEVLALRKSSADTRKTAEDKRKAPVAAAQDTLDAFSIDKVGKTSSARIVSLKKKLSNLKGQKQAEEFLAKANEEILPSADVIDLNGDATTVADMDAEILRLQKEALPDGFTSKDIELGFEGSDSDIVSSIQEALHEELDERTAEIAREEANTNALPTTTKEYKDGVKANKKTREELKQWFKDMVKHVHKVNDEILPAITAVQIAREVLSEFVNDPKHDFTTVGEVKNNYKNSIKHLRIPDESTDAKVSEQVNATKKQTKDKRVKSKKRGFVQRLLRRKDKGPGSAEEAKNEFRLRTAKISNSAINKLLEADNLQELVTAYKDIHGDVQLDEGYFRKTLQARLTGRSKSKEHYNIGNKVVNLESSKGIDLKFDATVKKLNLVGMKLTNEELTKDEKIKLAKEFVAIINSIGNMLHLMDLDKRQIFFEGDNLDKFVKYAQTVLKETVPTDKALLELANKALTDFSALGKRTATEKPLDDDIPTMYRDMMDVARAQIASIASSEQARDSLKKLVKEGKVSTKEEITISRLLDDVDTRSAMARKGITKAKAVEDAAIKKASDADVDASTVLSPEGKEQFKNLPPGLAVQLMLDQENTAVQVDEAMVYSEEYILKATGLSEADAFDIKKIDDPSCI